MQASSVPASPLKATRGAKRNARRSPGTGPAGYTITMSHATSTGGTPDDKLAQRAQELEAIRQAEQDTALTGDLREETGELSVVGQHPADVADFTYQRELQATTKQLLEREQSQIDAALRARETGTYGVCARCAQKIPSDRLAARPEATYCVECQRLVDSGAA